jgi:hypothetical protein
VDEGNGLENRRPARVRGFESHPLRTTRSAPGFRGIRTNPSVPLAAERGAVGWGSAGCRASMVGAGLRAGAAGMPSSPEGWSAGSIVGSAWVFGLWAVKGRNRESSALGASPSRLSAFGRSLDCPLAVVAVGLSVRPRSGSRGDRGQSPEPEVIVVGPRPLSPRERRNDHYRLGNGGTTTIASGTTTAGARPDQGSRSLAVRRRTSGV